MLWKRPKQELKKQKKKTTGKYYLPFKVSHLCNTDKNVGCLLLQKVMEGIFPGFLKQLMFDGDERCLTETLQGQNHPIGQKTVHQDPAVTAIITVLADN